MRKQLCKKHPENTNSFIGFGDGRIWYCAICFGISIGQFLKLENLGNGEPEKPLEN